MFNYIPYFNNVVNLSAASAIEHAKGSNPSAGVEGWNPYITSNSECWVASLLIEKL